MRCKQACATTFGIQHCIDSSERFEICKNQMFIAVLNKVAASANASVPDIKMYPVFMSLSDLLHRY